MLHKRTLLFLKELKKNNNREWFSENKYKFEEAKKDVVDFTTLILKKVSTFDTSLSNVDPAKCVMRIYRDVRFSKDKSPYKLNFGIPFSRREKNIQGPGYYLHIQPGESFVGGGYWATPPEHLKMIRQEIDYNTNEFLKIVTSKEFVKTFKTLSDEDKLKTTPKDYAKDHPAIEYLKLKSFVCFTPLSDEELVSDKAVNKIVHACKMLKPLNDFLYRAIE